MKIFKSSLALALVAIATMFTACSDEGYWDAADLKSQELYSFSAGSYTYTYPGDAEVTEIKVPVSRTQIAAAATLPIDIVCDSTVFGTGLKAEFAAGQSSTEVTIPVGKMVIGKNYIVNLSIDEDIKSPTGLNATKIAIQKEFTWAPWGVAEYTDDYVTTFFGVQNVPYEVEIEKPLGVDNIFRLKNPYGAAYPYNEPGDYDASKDYYMVINCEDPEGVYIERHNSGMNWGYGNFIMFSYAGYYLEKGNPLEAIKAAGFCGTLKDGVITFPAGALLVGMAEYNDGGLYQANTNGAFKVVLPK